MTLWVVRCSALIETVDEAWAYYRARFVGERLVLCKGVTVKLRFNGEEIHLFSEALREGSRPDPAKLVCRPGGGGEMRVFSRARAQLMDKIIATVCSPVAALEAKITGGRLLIGAPQPNAAAQRLGVVVAPDGDAYFVRTAYLMGDAEYRRARRNRPRPWPPHEK